WITPETPNGQARPIQSQRRNNGVYTRAIRQTRVNHRRGFIHTPSHPRDDAVDDLHQVAVVFEAESGRLDLTCAFNIDTIKPVHQDVGNRGVAQQDLERAKPEDFIENVAGKLFAFSKTKRNCLAVDRVADEQQHFFARRIAWSPAQLFQIKAIKDFAVQV